MKKIVFLSVLAVLLSFTTQAAGWMHFGCDNHFTACSSTETIITKDNASELERIWGVGCDDGAFSVISRSPAIFNNTLYTSGAGSKLRAYDSKTGTLKWSFGAGNLGWANQPTVASDGTVFYLEEGGTSGTLYTLYAVDPDHGTEIWHAPLQFNLGFKDTVIITVDESRNLVFMLEEPFEPDSGKIYALDKSTGAVVWYKSKQTDGMSFEGDYVLIDGNMLYTEGRIEEAYLYNDRLIAIDLDTRLIAKTYPRPTGDDQRDIQHVVLCGDLAALVYCDSDGMSASKSTVVVIDLESELVQWTKPLDGAITGHMAFNSQTGLLLIPTNPYLYAYNISDGSKKWEYLGYSEIYNPSVANGIVYCLSDNNMYAINESTGSLIWSYPLGYEAYETSQVAVHEGMLYFSGNGGTCDLFALGLPPPCTELSATITMPDHFFTPFDRCSTSITLCNPETHSYENVPLFAILEIYGNYYFAPDFSDFNHYTIELVPGWSEQVVFPEFDWPVGAGEVSDVMWYAAMTNPEMSELFGTYSTWAFGWGY